MIETNSKETNVRRRFAAGAKKRANKLCCPVDYDSQYLKVSKQQMLRWWQ